MRTLIRKNKYKEWRKEWEHKARVRVKLNKAVKSGRITRQPCEDCGADAGKSEGHHEDYSKPLDVIWLCMPCHRKRHRGGRAEGRYMAMGVYYYYAD